MSLLSTIRRAVCWRRRPNLPVMRGHGYSTDAIVNGKCVGLFVLKNAWVLPSHGFGQNPIP
jgi:hypothetical protein